MIEITPAILPKNYEELKDKIKTVRGLVPLVQVDICDGKFVKSRTWPFDRPRVNPSKISDLGNTEESDLAGLDQHFVNILNEEEGLPYWEEVDFELDLMVFDAVENFDLYLKLGAKRIIFHLEAVGDLDEFREFIEGMDFYIRENVELGVAFGPDADVEQYASIIELADYVQVMGIERIGYQGEEFSEKVFDVIEILKNKFPDVVLACDGGVNLENAPRLVEAGVSRLAIGSAIFNTDDIIGTIEEFQSL